MKYVICIDNSGREEYLTINNVYTILGESNNYYEIMGDDGTSAEYYKYRFKNMFGHKEHLEFIYNRLINIHNENEKTDYMRKFKEIIDEMI